ncbi:MAG TPA: tetratricopeptide repeat protein [Methylomirabilota bacterium]|nr:tetratricopeptide repeat protein [Methylomirabilota bacterium]
MRQGALVGSLLVLALATSAAAQSPLVAELETVAARYHENPGRLDTLREGLAQAVTTDAHPDNLIALARVSFIWGDIRAATPEQKLEAYDRGRQAAKRAVELAPRSALAHLWYGVNMGRWGQTKGIVRSLFLLPTVQEEIRLALELDPELAAAYALAGNVYYEVPSLLGGDLARAGEMFRKGLALDSKFTGMRVGLAKVLIKQNRLAEARRELQAVLDETAPSNLADWTLKDSRDARQLLESIRDRSRQALRLAGARACRDGDERDHPGRRRMTLDGEPRSLEPRGHGIGPEAQLAVGALAQAPAVRLAHPDEIVHPHTGGLVLQETRHDQVVGGQERDEAIEPLQLSAEVAEREDESTTNGKA